MMEADQPQRPAPTDYDAELRRHNEVLRRACDIQVGEHVLDVGCGDGKVTADKSAVAGDLWVVQGENGSCRGPAPCTRFGVHTR